VAVYFAVSRPRVYENRRLKTKALGFPRLVSRNHHETKCLCFEPLRFRFDQTWIVENVNEKQAHHNTRFRLWSQKSCSVQESCGSAGILGASQESWGQINISPGFLQIL